VNLLKIFYFSPFEYEVLGRLKGAENRGYRKHALKRLSRKEKKGVLLEN